MSLASDDAASLPPARAVGTAGASESAGLKDTDVGVSPPFAAHVAGSATAAIAAGAAVALGCRASCLVAAAQTVSSMGSVPAEHASTTDRDQARHKHLFVFR